MAHSTFHLARIASAAAAACALATAAHAQSTGNPTSTVTVVGRSLATSASVAGFGDTPLARTPLSASVFGAQQLADSGVRSIGGLTALDASLGDAYNAEGYWSILSARGYTLDNRFNYRRDGLPINAETAIALDNKERVEMLKGISGIQAGTSAPGGVVNLVTKRANSTVRSAMLEARQGGSLLAAVDLGDRFGADGRYGLRLNAAAERLDPRVRNSRGERTLLALAGGVQLTPDTLLQADIETSHQRQPSVAGFSLLGDTVPDPKTTDLLHNLNDQPWRQPVVLDGTTTTLRLQQRLSERWSLVAQALQQRLKSDDGTAFPYGVYDAATYECPQWCDRYAPDGSFTYWEYVSNNERRTTNALSLTVSGSLVAAGMNHQLEMGVLRSRYRGRFQDQIFDIAGTGNVDGSLSTPPSFGGTDANTDRDERSTELFVRDAVTLAPGWQLWAGLRHTRLDRESRRTSPASDGLRATDYSQGLTAPWLALSHELAPRTVVYASWGQGLESDVAPNRARYTNAGQALPALKSRQVEAGLKHEGDNFDGSLAFFDIDRPQAVDAGSCGAAGTCTRVSDGSARHRGLEASMALRQALVTWQASAMWLDAERRGAVVDPSVNGQRPVNVPKATLRLGAELRVPAVPGLALLAHVAAESDRKVLPYDPSITIPGWSRIDLGARWRQAVGSNTLVWRVALDNATDRRAWKEAPYQFGHAYLYALPLRSWRASVQTAF
ncbi:MAG: TonB-dependent siderophore receptor [Rubrivivax sp.]|nr:TonB-dependent siderophore receptor [Rubrivivax sp.]